SLHSLKGSAGSVSLIGVTRLAHRIEDRVLALGGRALEETDLSSLAAAAEHLRSQVVRTTRPAPAPASGGAPAAPPAEPRIRGGGERRSGSRRGCGGCG